MSDFSLTSIHTDYAGRCYHSPTLRSRLSRQQPNSDADRAMEYLALQARWLPAHALALDSHARPCPSFSPHHLIRHVGTIGRCIVDFYDCPLQILDQLKLHCDMSNGRTYRIGSMTA